jgi:hypothetical protein
MPSILAQLFGEVNSHIDPKAFPPHSGSMEEYLRRSHVFQKRLSINPGTRRDARYLLFRMACPIMQAKLYRFIDLNQVPTTFIHGNPHIDNYVRTDRGSAMMDFDRSRMGPYCWDIIRFLSALSLKRNDQDGFLDRKVVECFIDSYISHYLNPDLPHRQLKMLKSVNPEKWQRSGNDYLAANKRWAKKMRDTALSPKADMVVVLLKKFLESRREENLMDDFYIDEVGGTPGSFGKKHFIYSLKPRNRDSYMDAIILDIKEVYEEKNNKFFYSPFAHHGLRMIEASKIFSDGLEERLGYCTHQNRQYWGRQIPTFAIKVKNYLNLEEQMDFAHSVASDLAKGHRKGLKDPKHPELIEKDLTQNFDKYYKISKLLTYELKLSFEALERKIKLYKDFRSW